MSTRGTTPRLSPGQPTKRAPDSVATNRVNLEGLLDRFVERLSGARQAPMELSGSRTDSRSFSYHSCAKRRMGK